MSNNHIQLPDSFIKGLVCIVRVSKDGKKSHKELKVCTVKTRSITFIEVDRQNRKNVFRKVKRTDIVDFCPTAICEVTIRDGVLPDRWESGWDSIGQFSPSVGNSFGRRAFSNHSKGWSSNAPQYHSTTNNPVSGFPMV